MLVVPSPCFLAARNGLSHQLLKTLPVLMNTLPRSVLQLLPSQPQLELEPLLSVCHHIQKSLREVQTDFFRNHLTYLSFFRYPLWFIYQLFYKALIHSFCIEMCSSFWFQTKMSVVYLVTFCSAITRMFERNKSKKCKFWFANFCGKPLVVACLVL